MHLCARFTAASWLMEPFRESGVSLQLSSRTQFTKISNKKVIAENQCKQIKTSKFFYCFFLYKNIRGKSHAST